MDDSMIYREIPQEEGMDVFGEIADYGDLEAVVALPCGCGCGVHNGGGQGA